jgi:ferredoxin
MDSLVIVLDWFYFLTIFLLAILSIYSFVQEKEWKALIKGILIFGPFSIFIAILLVFNFPIKPWIILSILVVNGIIILLIILPLGKPHSIGIKGEQKSVDERDALFHRFYRLKPGTSEYEAYYRDHPEKFEFDQKLRSMPGLGNPGSKAYHPFTSPFQEAIFSVLGGMTREIEWQPEPIEGKPIQATPEEFTQRIKGFASYLGADLVGTTRLNPAYIYSHIARGAGEWGTPIELNHTHAIAIAVEMRHDMIRHAPETPTITESAFSYYKNAKIALILAKYINLLSYEARAHVDGNYRVMCIPIASDAGLGELGRLGLLVTPEFGPRVRLSVVTTNLPLLQDKPIAFGVQHFCSVCKKCAVNCPTASIDIGEKAVHNGVEKWLSDQDNCYRFWRIQGTDCAICVKVCPYSYPRAPMHNMIRWLVRRNSFARRIAFMGDEFFYGKRPKHLGSFPAWHNQK